MNDPAASTEPRWHHVAMAIDEPRLLDVGAATAASLRSSGVVLHHGWEVAIALGSRGISDLSTVVDEVVRWVREQGAVPFFVPAMGSHGGATAEGQRAVLAAYGFTPERFGCEVRATMDVVELPRGDCPVMVVTDAEAAAADATIIVNRVKPHTDFHGPVESGISKMSAIGLGNRVAAEALHSYGVRGLRDLMPLVAKQVLAHSNIVLGVAIVENALDQTMIVEALPVSKVREREVQLLEVARAHMPRLLVEDLDVLIIDQMGKDISGVGMDTNVIGRLLVTGESEPASPRVSMISCHHLTSASHGNATGIGLADVVTRAVADDIDHAATRENIVTSGFLLRGKLPVVADDDRHAWQLCCRGAGVIDVAGVRAMRIVDTLHVAEAWVSDAVLEELGGDTRITVARADLEMFDAAGRLTAFSL
ncbi:MAG: DUF2088 domain-containing protein [Acidimicrobiia bacterium]